MATRTVVLLGAGAMVAAVIRELFVWGLNRLQQSYDGMDGKHRNGITIDDAGLGMPCRTFRQL